MPRRKRGYPTITWSKSKQAYRCTVSLNGKRRDIYGKTEDEVMDKIDALEAEIATGIDKSMTLTEYGARWAVVKFSGIKPKSIEVYDNVLKNHILPRLGSMPLCEIKPLHVDELLGSMSGKSSSLRSKVLFTLSQIFESAIENDLVEKNPCRNKKAGGEKAKVKTPLTREQQDALCEAVQGARAELFVLLCLYAGLRREEALGLLWSNVRLDVDTPYIDVRHTVTFEDGNKPVHSKDLKSDAAYRSIPIPPKLIDALKAARAKTESIFVVPAMNTGGAMSHTAFRRMWDIVNGYSTPEREKNEEGKWVIKKDKDNKTVKRFVPGVVGFHVEPHVLRHTYITELCASGLDVKKVQYLAGHATVQMTLNTYAHVTQNKPEQLAPAIITAFSAGNNAGNESAKGA